jgi:hypothetical protein
MLASGTMITFNLAPSAAFPGEAGQFMTALQNTGYILFIVGILKLLVGLSLLINRFVPLALILFMPITINMILFHAFLAVSTIIPALIIGFLNVFLLYSYIESYRPLFQSKTVVRAKE